MFLNNLGHDVVIKLSKYGEEQAPINIIVPNGKTYYWPIGGFGNDDKDSIKMDSEDLGWLFQLLS